MAPISTVTLETAHDPMTFPLSPDVWKRRAEDCGGRMEGAVSTIVLATNLACPKNQIL